ncbi:MAG: hypothetical protein QOC81_1510 [Thermoanaerobaculia bacterium]|jgi:uncharacterized protein (DUF488 family)|nr:hypothetical protein [Thermoanaerobaculia bacterium]
MQIFTIGHSTRTADEFLALLRQHEIALLADIRRYPGSKRYPHFASSAMAAWLPENGVAYVHMPELGGRRKPLADSPNTAWRNEQFRAYADYMATEAFHTAIDELLARCTETRTAIMCAEAVPWRCHRNMVADELLRRGNDVLHIIGSGSARPHVMNEHAVVDGDHLTYPAEQRTLRL